MRRKHKTPTGNECAAPEVFVDDRDWPRLSKIALYDHNNKLIAATSAETFNLNVVPGDKVSLTVNIL